MDRRPARPERDRGAFDVDDEREDADRERERGVETPQREDAEVATVRHGRVVREEARNVFALAVVEPKDLRCRAEGGEAEADSKERRGLTAIDEDRDGWKQGVPTEDQEDGHACHRERVVTAHLLDHYEARALHNVV